MEVGLGIAVAIASAAILAFWAGRASAVRGAAEPATQGPEAAPEPAAPRSAAASPGLSPEPDPAELSATLGIGAERRATHTEDFFTAVVDGARAQLATDSPVQLTLTLSPELPVRIVADLRRGRAALSCLLDHALAHTRAGGIQLSVEPRGEGLRLSLSDTSPGLSAETLTAAVLRGDGPSGTSLRIWHQLVAQLGGDAHYDSTPEVGSHFAFTLPFSQAEASPEPEAQPPPDEAAPQPEEATPPSDDMGPVRGRVLVVDDNEINLRIASRALIHRGYQVETAENGLAALRAHARGCFDAVLMDCRMPEMDGIEAARRIRMQEAPGQRIPIFALTASPHPGDRNRCMDAGMDGYLLKPVDFQALDDMLQRARSAATVPLDEARLERLVRELDDPHFAAEIISDCLGRMRTDIADMRAAWGAGDGQRLRSVAHAHKSLSAYVGAQTVSSLCDALQLLPLDSLREEAPPLLDALETAMGLARPPLEQQRSALLATSAPAQHPKAVAQLGA